MCQNWSQVKLYHEVLKNDEQKNAHQKYFQNYIKKLFFSVVHFEYSK